MEGGVKGGHNKYTAPPRNISSNNKEASNTTTTTILIHRISRVPCPSELGIVRCCVPLVLCVCLPVRPLFERNGRTDATAASVAAMLVGGWLECSTTTTTTATTSGICLKLYSEGRIAVVRLDGWMVGWMPLLENYGGCTYRIGG